jgi:LmbE family N-acetylglucosaminyl deacetylase
MVIGRGRGGAAATPPQSPPGASRNELTGRRRPARPGRLVVACLVALAAVGASVVVGDGIGGVHPKAFAVEGCGPGSAVGVVAHPDDDLLFLNPDVLHDIAAGGCVTVVFVTSGDAGLGTGYSRQRERGLQAAYAHMAGVADDWTQTTVAGGARTVTRVTLDLQPRVQLIFLRLPDGGVDGSGSAASRGTSLQKLYQGSVASLTTMDEPDQTYTTEELVQTLGWVMTSVGATSVRTLDNLGNFGDGDHSDHYAVARLAVLAQQQYAPDASIRGYLGYPVTRLPQNVSGTDLAAKEEAISAYVPFDSLLCQTREDCSGLPQAAFLPRQYAADALEGVPPLDQPGNVARTAEVSASSQNAGGGQTADKAVDGLVDGWPGDRAAEWATDGQGSGSSLVLTWGDPVTLDRVVLYDRPNRDDQILGATLTFPDGSEVTVPALDNAGGAVTVTFPARSTTALRLTVTEVSGTTHNVGLAEMQAYGA